MGTTRINESGRITTANDAPSPATIAPVPGRRPRDIQAMPASPVATPRAHPISDKPVATKGKSGDATLTTTAVNAAVRILVAAPSAPRHSAYIATAVAPRRMPFADMYSDAGDTCT